MSVKPGKLLSGEELLQSHINNDRTLPKIGERQFKPMNSWLEKKQVESALEESKQLLYEERVEKIGALAQANWYNNKRLAEVTRKVGKHFHTMGFEKDGKLFIYPEEALYLMEMNCLQLRYNDVPLSIQQGYSLLLHSQGCSLKEYRTYSHLTKQGYRLLRHNKVGMPTNYEQRIRLDQHVPQKRVFPEANVVTVEPLSDEVAPSSGTCEEEGSRPIAERSEASNSHVKSEKDSAEVNEPMKNFAKSIADMGKTLVKTEKGGGSEGLGFESLRKKILDMLEDHFQGQISPEAMDAVSLSASKAIMVHVDDNDSEKRCDTPNLNESEDRSSDCHQDCSVNSESKPPNEEDSAERVLSAREGDAGVSEKKRVKESGEGTQAMTDVKSGRRMGEESREAAQTTTDEATQMGMDVECGVGTQMTTDAVIEKRMDAKTGEDESTTDVVTEKRMDEESGESAQTTTDMGTQKVMDKESGEADQRTTDGVTQKRMDEGSGEAAQTTTDVVTEKRKDDESGEFAQTTTDMATQKVMNKESGEADQRTTDGVTQKRMDEGSGEAAQTTTGVVTEKRKDEESGNLVQTTTDMATQKVMDEGLGEADQRTTDGVTQKRMDDESGEAAQTTTDVVTEKTTDETGEAAQTTKDLATQKRIDEESGEAAQTTTDAVTEKRMEVESGEAAKTTTDVVTEKRTDVKLGEEETTTDVVTQKRMEEESGEIAQTTDVVTEKRMEEESGEVAQTTTDVVTEKRIDEESDECTQKTEELIGKRTDEKSEEASQKTKEVVGKRTDEKSKEATKRTEEVVGERRVQESDKLAQTISNEIENSTDKLSEAAVKTKTHEIAEKSIDKESEEAGKTKSHTIAEKRREEVSGEAVQKTTLEIEERIDEKCGEGVKNSKVAVEKITDGQVEEAAQKRKTTETEVSKTDKRRRYTSSSGAETSYANCSGSKEPSSLQLSEPRSKNGTKCKGLGKKIGNRDEESSGGETDLEEEMEVECPVEGTCTSGSDSSEEEPHTDAFECPASQTDIQIDDDIMEIEDPNSWKNIKVEKNPAKGNTVSQKNPFTDSNGWRSLKQSLSNTSTGKNTQSDDDNDDDVDIVAVRNAKDIEVEVIDISEDSCVKPIQRPRATEEIEIVDLDESDSSSNSSSGKPDVKQEKSPAQRSSYASTLGKTRKRCSVRPHLASAFERARDKRRKYIMDCFPNMFQQGVCTFEVPSRNLLPPNISPMRHAYTIARRALCAERPNQSFNPTRRPFNLPKVNNYYNNSPRPYHPRQPYKPPANVQPWQGRASAPINPAAMQAFQMITSIVLPMFGLNNMGPRFMGQPQWNQGPMWQQSPRNWQNHQQWRYQRPPNQWNNRYNRPWHNNRNSEREQQDVVLDRPKRPTLLPISGLPPADPVWHDERSSQEPRRPKRPFVVEDNARELLLEIEDEARWKKIKRMEEESDTDSESEVTITPINRTPKTSDLQPLLRLENCKSSIDIMASIDVIKRADPRSLNATTANRMLKISYDLFLPNIPFRKSSPPTPNFRLCIMTVEEPAPNPGEISLLLDHVHDGVPLMFAIVSPEIVSYYQFATVDLPKHTFSS